MGLFTPGSEIFASLLRGKPNLPGFDKIDLQDEQAKAIGGNSAMLPALENQASGINAFNMDQLSKMLEKSIPMYQKLKSSGSSAIADMIAGKIPKADQDVIQNSDAAKALGGGYAGGGMHRDLVARDLGINALEETRKGLSAAEDWFKTVGSIESPKLFDFTSMFVTPGMQTSVDTSERNSKFQHDWTGNQIDWQSSLGYAAGNELQTDSSQLNSMIGSVAGSVAGGAGSGGGM